MYLSYNNSSIKKSLWIIGIITDDYYCGSQYHTVSRDPTGVAYRYGGMIVCVLGALANSVNIFVFTRKDMKNSTNALLTGLAVADLLVLVGFIPFLAMDILALQGIYLPHTYTWTLIRLLHTYFSHVCHTTTICLTVTVACWRYIAVVWPLKCRSLCSMKRAKWTLVLVYLASPLLSLPIFLNFSISEFSTDIDLAEEPVEHDISNSSSLASTLASYVTAFEFFNYSSLARNYPIFKKITVWYYSVALRILPCTLLTFISIRLIMAILKANKERDLLSPLGEGGSYYLATRVAGGAGWTGSIGSSRSLTTRSNRTTKILLAVLLLYLITEFPILVFLSGIFGDSYFETCYGHMGDLADFLVLVNSASNFIFYFSLSTKFREIVKGKIPFINKR